LTNTYGPDRANRVKQPTTVRESEIVHINTTRQS